VDPVLRRSAAHVVVADVDVPCLDEASAHHLVRVLRLRDGASVTVTDGAGSWRPCAMAGGSVQPTGEVVRAPSSTVQLTVAVSPPKGDRLDWLVAKATEVGVDRIVLLDAERSVVRLRADRAARQLERLRRIASEAGMQARRVRLPTIEGPVVATEWLSDVAVAVAEPGGRALRPGDASIAVGPEGGWSAAELASVDLDRMVSLAANVLRVETAAVTAAVLMAANHEAVGR
jgi:16S rRNA (uracil1498-N3)-methyltransferase